MASLEHRENKMLVYKSCEMKTTALFSTFSTLLEYKTVIL